MRYIISLVLAVFLLSCKKEDIKEPQFPSELSLTSIKRKQGIRLFTNRREIVDPQTINNFVKGSVQFGVQDSVVTTNEKITFKSIDSVFVGSISSPYTIENHGDTLQFISTLEGWFSEEVARLLYPMSRYRGMLVYSPFFGYMAKNIIVGYGNYSHLKLSAYNYRLVRTGSYSHMDGLRRSVYSGNTFNEFDTSYINSVQDTDTLAIEEYSCIFEKR